MAPHHQKSKFFQSQAASIAGIYAVFAFLWILFSDWVLGALVSDVKTLTYLQTLKGWFFVAVTAALVYGLVHRQVSKLLQTEKSLQISEEKYRELVEGTDDLITQVDAQGKFTYVNHSSARYLGIPPTECVGLKAFDFIHADDREHTQTWFMDCLTHQIVSDSIENRQVSRTGEITPMLWTVNFRYRPDGSLEGIRSIARDITERKKAEQSLHENLRIRSEFISTAAHELRTPLAVVMGYSEMLLNEAEMGGFNAEQRKEFLTTIHEKSEVLAEIVDELLDLSKIDAGQKLSLELEDCNLFELIEKTASHFKTRFPDRTILLETCKDCSHNCWADPGRMRQVIENLLDNAVKYSPPQAGITVGCQRNPGHCMLFVSDQGIGMSKEQKEKIFDKFYRANASNTAINGLGLGLSIVSYIVEGHGGKIEVESEPGQGTTMKVALPHRIENNPGTSCS